MLWQVGRGDKGGPPVWASVNTWPSVPCFPENIALSFITGGLTSPSLWLSTRTERAALTLSTRGLMRRWWHTYGRWEKWKERRRCVFILPRGEAVPYTVMLVPFQYALATDSFQLGYNEEGHCKGEVDSSLPRPQKLNWEIPPEVSHAFSNMHIFFYSFVSQWLLVSWFLQVYLQIVIYSHVTKSSSEGVTSLGA